MQSPNDIEIMDAKEGQSINRTALFHRDSPSATGSQDVWFMNMKILFPRLAAMLLSLACVLTGCQTPKAQPSSGSRAAHSTRNNCYSLLHQLLNDEKNVGLLRFIKREEDDVKQLVKKIAANCAVGAKLLEELASHDPSINLDDLRLPPGETATRDAIAATKKRELMGQSGAEFELTLLLTQAQALSYGWHLAKVATENEPQPDRARALAGVSEDMQNLYHEVFMLLLSRTTSLATNSMRAQPN